VRVLRRRLASPCFAQAVRALPYLRPPGRDVVVRHVLRGQPVRDVARRLACTLHQVRMELKLAEGIMAGLAAEPPAPIRARA
jgi:DNA-directed RNA polymerase specialized sigma24 family protein